MPDWFVYVEESCNKLGVSPLYVFVSDRRDPTRKVIDTTCEALGRTVRHVDVIERVKEEPHEHAWANTDNLEKMVQLRNLLLEEVRRIEPAMFLSLDSDILANPLLVTNLVETLMEDQRRFAAVGGKCYMSNGRTHPSYAYYGHMSGLQRKDQEPVVIQVDIIMAIKLMGPEAYNVDYSFHKDGEDVGWSLTCKEKGLRLGWDGREVSKHVMNKQQLNVVDKRCGY